MIDLIYITNIPSFYKINLFNRIAEQRKILVIFTHDFSNQRNTDFYKGDREFEFISIGRRSLFDKIYFLLRLLQNKPYKHLIIGGWDQLLFWFAAFISPKHKNGVVIESSIFESTITGYKGFMKKIFLSRISRAFVSGKSQVTLVISLRFSGQIIVTKGVGIFSIRPQEHYKVVSKVNNFIFVGRLSPEKNLRFLIETFNQLPELTLNIVGYGPQEMLLKSIAKQNTVFHGAVPNSELNKFYQQNDVFILPSLSETWGVVVEEALNNGLPVIVSDKVGCAPEIVDESNGIVFKTSEPDGLLEAIIKIREINFYNSLKLNVSKLDFDRIAHEQVSSYL